MLYTLFLWRINLNLNLNLTPSLSVVGGDHVSVAEMPLPSRLRSSSSNRLDIRPSSLVTVGRPVICLCRPQGLQQSPQWRHVGSIVAGVLRRRLKTHLFRLYRIQTLCHIVPRSYFLIMPLLKIWLFWHCNVNKLISVIPPETRVTVLPDSSFVCSFCHNTGVWRTDRRKCYWHYNAQHCAAL